jgi:cell division septal protein FtsQ
MFRIAFLTIVCLILAGGVSTLLVYLALLLKGYFAADRVEARKAKIEADDAIYELARARRLAKERRPK